MKAHKLVPGKFLILNLGIFLIVSIFSVGCTSSEAEPNPVQSIQELMVCSWEDDAIGVVINDFFMEYGIRIQLYGYSSQEEIIEKMRAGHSCDLLVIQSDAIPSLVEDGLIIAIDYTNVPNFRNISVNFRNLAYDPSNKYSIPYNWGTTGLVVRNDLVGEGVHSWKDLWNESYQGKVAVWASRPRYTIGAALLSLGYSANSENPQELEAAFQLLSQVKQRTVWIEHEGNFVNLLQEGKVWFGMGWADDFWLAKEGAGTFQYILPREGSILWSSVFAIPKNSANQKTAAILINYLLDPEVSAKIINQGHYAVPNELAIPFVAPELLADPSIYPPEDVMQNSEILLPLSEQGQYLHDQIWERFRVSVAQKGSE
jgi:spermidine/putrescine transport system substrate-binding protein